MNSVATSLNHNYIQYACLYVCYLDICVFRHNVFNVFWFTLHAYVILTVCTLLGWEWTHKVLAFTVMPELRKLGTSDHCSQGEILITLLSFSCSVLLVNKRMLLSCQFCSQLLYESLMSFHCRMCLRSVCCSM